MTTGERRLLPRGAFDRLLDALRTGGYRCVGPTVRDGAIVYERVTRAADLPRGMRDDQAPGSYRLTEAGDDRLFAWANGPQALKPHLFAPTETLWRADRDAEGRIRFRAAQPPAERIAVIGVRACDLAALALQDQHFLEGRYPDPHYAARRAGLLLVAVNCSHPAATCFCASTGDGPHASHGFDLALTELDDGFVVHAGSEAGAEVLAALDLPAAGARHVDGEQRQAEASAAVQQRALPGRNLRDTLFARLEHARWEDVAARCLSCGNCTQVCPTCFCHSEHDVPDVGGGASEHVREWDSCFTAGHAWMHGHQVRPDTRTRYRQWLTHKLGSWHDQYGRSGCTGCGRCITWCPVGIDITEEAAALCSD